jgi:hypothetical protein
MTLHYMQPLSHKIVDVTSMQYKCAHHYNKMTHHLLFRMGPKTQSKSIL